MADTSPDWNDIQGEYMETRDQRADISEEDAERRRQAQRLNEIEERLRQEQARMEQGPQHIHPPMPDMDAMEQPIAPPPNTWAHTVVTHDPAGVATTQTTWDDSTGGNAGIAIADAAQQPYYSYTTPSIDKEAIKEALKEVLGEMFDEDVNFINWLRLKYTLIPVNPEGLKKKRKRRKNVSSQRSRAVPTSRAGLTGTAIGGAGGAASLGGVSLRSDVQSGESQRTPPPDQGSGERSAH